MAGELGCVGLPAGGAGQVRQPRFGTRKIETVTKARSVGEMSAKHW